MSIVIGIILFILGIIITLKAEWMYDNFGALETIEHYFRTSGGTRVFWKLFGILISFIGIMIATHLIEAVLLAVLRPLFGRLYGF